jgi:SGNH domain (fused to AT3 domains)
MPACSRVGGPRLVRLNAVGLAFGVLLAFVAVWTVPASAQTTKSVSGAQLAAAKQCTYAACPKVVASVAAGTKLKKLPSNLSPSLSAAAKDIYPPTGFLGCVANQAAVSDPLPCVINSSATAKRMVLIGDSHAEMWSPAFADIAKANGYSLLFLAKIPCPLPMVPFWNELNSTPNTQCTAWKKWAINRINQFNPSLVVATTEDFQLYGKSAEPINQGVFSKGFVTTLKDLSAPDRKVVLLGDISYLTSPGPQCLAAHETSVTSCSTATAAAVSAKAQMAERSAAVKAGAAFINVIPWLCTTKECPAIVGHYNVYQDCCHISATYGISLEPILSEALGLPTP